MVNRSKLTALLTRLINLIFIITSLSIFIARIPSIQAHEIGNVSMAEIAQTADLIFIGTVKDQHNYWNSNHTVIFNDVHFTNIELIHKKSSVKLNNSLSIDLTFVGGQIGDEGMSLCTSIKLQNSDRYLIFAKYDGHKYDTPVIGGTQGIFKVVKDQLNSNYYITNLANQVLFSLDNDQLQFTDKRTKTFAGGKIIFDETKATQQQKDFKITAQHGTKLISNSRANISKQLSAEYKPVKVQDMIKFIQNSALKIEIKASARKLRTGGDGMLYTKDANAQLIKRPVPLTTKKYQPAKPDIDAQGQDLYACGSQRLPIVFENDNTFDAATNDNSMFEWNQYMDLFRVRDSDGSFAYGNGQNEFVGFLNEQSLNQSYGVSFGGSAIALTIFAFSTKDCITGKILETDIVYNPAYDYTTDLDEALNNRDLVLLKPILMHELGHSWGYQSGLVKELYDYDQLSVMHGDNKINEDGNGVHAADAYFIRRNYQDQININNIVDMGVETYSAIPNGGSFNLKDADLDQSSYRAGDEIFFSDIVVENMGLNTENNVNVNFYLSRDNNITSSDIFLGNYIYDSFDGEAYSVFSGSVTIPNDINDGQYYLGVMVTSNRTDDIPANNAAFFRRPVQISGGSGNSNNGNISLSVTPSNRDVEIGKSVTYNINIDRGGSNGSIDLDLYCNSSNCPKGFSYSAVSFSTSSSNASLTISTDNNAQIGSYQFFFRATINGVAISDSNLFTVNVIKPGNGNSGGNSSVAIAIDALKTSINAGESVTFNLNLRRNNFSSPVTISVFVDGDLPDGISLDKQDFIVNGNTDSFTIFTDSITPAGSYSFFVEGSANGITIPTSNKVTINVAQANGPVLNSANFTKPFLNIYGSNFSGASVFINGLDKTFRIVSASVDQLTLKGNLKKLGLQLGSNSIIVANSDGSFSNTIVANIFADGRIVSNSVVSNSAVSNQMPSQFKSAKLPLK